MSPRRLVAEDGVTSTQVAVLFPALLAWLLLIVQAGLWWHANQVATAAAAEAVDAASALDARAADGDAAARSFLARAGNLSDVEVRVERGTEVVVVEVEGDTPRLIPGLAWSVAARAEARVEKFVPEPQR